MDKIAANNHFVSLRKEAKKAKAMVAGNLIRKINKLKQEKEKATDDAQKDKIKSKIERIYSETKLLKGLDLYEVCKEATLKSGTEIWDKILAKTQSTPEERLKARLICKNSIQKRVKTFREENTDLDEWIDEYIEYREKKREIKEHAGLLPKTPQRLPTGKSNSFSNDKTKAHGKKPGMRKVNDNKPRHRVDSSSMDSETSGTKLSTELESEQLHPSWDAKRKQKNVVKMALEGQVKSHKIDLTNLD